MKICNLNRFVIVFVISALSSAGIGGAADGNEKRRTSKKHDQYEKQQKSKQEPQPERAQKKSDPVQKQTQQRVQLDKQQEQRRQEKQQQQDRQQFDYDRDPYFYTAPIYRYNRGGSYHEINEYGARTLRQAVSYGYEEGFRAGKADRDDRWGFNYKDSYAYRDANYGYSGYYVDRSDYNYYFREGFQRGYEDGYNSRYKYRSLREWKLFYLGYHFIKNPQFPGSSLTVEEWHVKKCSWFSRLLLHDSCRSCRFAGSAT